MNKNKRTLYAKVLLGCLAGSYLQMFGAVMPIFAQEVQPSFTVEITESSGVLSYELIPVENVNFDEDDYDLSQIWSDVDCDLNNDNLVDDPSCGVFNTLTYTPAVLSTHFVYVTAANKLDSAVVYYAKANKDFTVVATPEITVDVKADGNGNLVSTVTPADSVPELELAYNWYKDCAVDDNDVVDFENCMPIPGENKSSYKPVFSEKDSIYYSSITIEQESFYSVGYKVVFPVLDESVFFPLTYNAGERMVFSYEAEEFETVTAAFDGGTLLVDPNLKSNVWVIESGVMETAGNYTLSVTVASEDGFSDSADFNVVVKASSAVAANSTLSVTKDGVDANYVEVESGDLEIVFEARDAYRNKIGVTNLDRVDVRLNGVLLEGVNVKGKDVYRVERTVGVPSVENLESAVTVDVFSSECDGTLGTEENYCFSKVHDLVIYDTKVESVKNLVYVKRTNEGTVRVSGTKLAGYGIKLNSVTSAYVVEPNNSTVFSFEMPLAEGSNLAMVYAVKSVSADLEFYSKAVKFTVVKDTTVSPIEWNEPAILLDGENQATLRWTDPSDYDFDHVNIYRSTVPNFVPNANNLIVQTHNPSWTDTGLDAGSGYYYAIEAVDDLGNTSVISPVIASGAILGESATVVATADDIYEYQYVGKGAGEDVVTGTEVTEEVGEENSEDQDSEDVVENQGESEETGESFGAKLKEFFNNAKDSASTVFSNVTSNIFVQICVGGVLIFVGLMFLISVLVWLKEKIVDARLVHLDDDEKDDSDK